MTQNPTKISITGKLTYSDEITISQAAKIIDYLNSDASEATSSDLGDPSLNSGTKKNKNASKVLSPREALELSGAQKNPEKIVALGAYVLRTAAKRSRRRTSRRNFVVRVRRPRQTSHAT